MHHALVIVAKNTKSVAYLKPNQCFTTTVIQTLTKAECTLIQGITY